MAVKQFSAHLRAQTGRPLAGVVHIRTRLTGNFTVLPNRLLQRRGSALAIGLMAYILSVPDGTKVRIEDLCERFTEGYVRVSGALRELAAEGWIEYRVEKAAAGRFATRTYAYTLPGCGSPKAESESESEAERSEPVSPAAVEPEPEPRPKSVPPPGPASEPRGEARPDDPRAAIVLASLRQRDPRLVLSRQDIARLAPAVTAWLERGASPQAVVATLTEGLPAPLKRAPAGIVAYRLREFAPPLTPEQAAPAQQATAKLTLQECSDCRRPYRAAAPGLCRDCRVAKARAESAQRAEGQLEDLPVETYSVTVSSAGSKSS